MNTENLLLEEKFITIKHGKCMYIHIKDANKFIDFCDQEKFIILGFEGLYCGDSYIKPDLGLIADFQFKGTYRKEEGLIFPDYWEEYYKKSIIFAHTVIADFPKADDLYIDFVIKSKEEFEREAKSQ